ncbi:MAG: hypothetical protein ABSE62_04620 [Chthoniobacteraceae bacterium]|jgi:hypothetical protein
MKMDENDRLWELLGKTRQPSVSPFFARNVLRAVRQEEGQEGRGSLFSRLYRWLLRRSWQVAITGTCMAAVLITVSPETVVRQQESAPAPPGVDQRIVSNPDYEVIMHLDELVADEESSLWLDDSAHTVR